MKNNKILATSLLGLSVVFMMHSCSQDEVIYSCNKEIDSWVKENKEVIQQMTRSQWCELNYNVSTASYVAFTQSQKIEFWKDKLVEVQCLDWTKDELSHIKKAEEFIIGNPEYFRKERLSVQEYDEIEMFFVRWTKYGIRNFGWTKKIAMAIIGTGFKMLDTQGNLLIPSGNNDTNTLSTAVISSTTEVTCNCNKESLFTCINDPFGPCEATNCKESSGCGFLMLYDCDGTCGGI